MGRHRAWWGLALAVGALVMLLGRPAAAEEAERSPALVVGKLRLAAPGTSWSFLALRNNDLELNPSFPLFIGGSLAAEVREAVAVEVGARTSFTFGADAYVRAGTMPKLRDWRGGAGVGTVIQVPLLVGVRYLAYNPQLLTDMQAHSSFLCLTAAAGLEATRWLARHFGLTARTLVGLSVPVHEWATSDAGAPGPEHPRFWAGLDFSVDVGLAF
ncbi:MAG TPA: hypothetical protein VGQ83_18955 [Polyangia bacterium]|jgi:hypothetical protein